MRPLRSLIAISSAALLASFVGCGGSNIANVEGQITLDGAAVPSASVSLVPSGGGAQAYAMSDESGHFEAYTGREEGVTPGEYKVTVVARERPAVNQTESGGPAPPGKALTPRWYASPETSGLAIIVEPGDNDVNLELNTTPPPGWQDPAKKR